MKSIIRLIESHIDFTLRNDCSDIQFSYDTKRRSWDVVTNVRDGLTIRQYTYTRPKVIGDYLTIISTSDNLNISINLSNYTLEVE